MSPKFAFACVSFSLGELGDGLNIFQGIYLVGIGWNEGNVGLALSLMGLTSLVVQAIAGDIVDKTSIDRRIFLAVASIVTAISASAILLVREGNTDHMLIFITKVIEGVAGSFIGPCLAALTLATFGPNFFDSIMANNILWGHVGSVIAAILAGSASYLLYPNIKYCFLVIGASALLACAFVGHLPEGDPLMGRGFKGKIALDQEGHVEKIGSGSFSVQDGMAPPPRKEAPVAATYWAVFSDRTTTILCLTGFFFHFANANVLLVLGEIMGGDNDDGSPKRSAIPLIGGAIVLAQLTMAAATVAGGRLTFMGVGRKPLFMAGIALLPLRCILIIWWKDWGEAWLLSTQILDGLSAGLCGLIHPYLVADITFGTGRFNVLMGVTASFFGLGATLSNFLGQLAVEKMGHVASLSGSTILSIIPVILFGLFMPETMGRRGELCPIIEEAEEDQSEDMSGTRKTLGDNSDDDELLQKPYMQMS